MPRPAAPSGRRSRGQRVSGPPTDDRRAAVRQHRDGAGHEERARPRSRVAPTRRRASGCRPRCAPRPRPAGILQFAASGSTDTVGCWTIDHCGGEAMRSSTGKPNGQPVGSSTSCVAHSERKPSTRSCTTSTNSGVASAWTFTFVACSGLSESTATPRGRRDRRVDRDRVEAGREDEEGHRGERVGIRTVGRDLPLVDLEAVDLEAHRAEDGEVDHGERAAREAPRRREADLPVALDVERRAARVAARRCTRRSPGSCRRRRLGHDLDVGQGRERGASQERIGCRRPEAPPPRARPSRQRPRRRRAHRRRGRRTASRDSARRRRSGCRTRGRAPGCPRRRRRRGARRRSRAASGRARASRGGAGARADWGRDAGVEASAVRRSAAVGGDSGVAERRPVARACRRVSCPAPPDPRDQSRKSDPESPVHDGVRPAHRAQGRRRRGIRSLA